MTSPVNQFAYILQVALVFAAWQLVPVQQASQISSVWHTDPIAPSAINQSFKSPFQPSQDAKEISRVNKQAADFSSTLAGSLVDPQASSFKPTIVGLDAPNQVRRRAGEKDAEEDERSEAKYKNFLLFHKLQKQQQIGKRSEIDLQSYNNPNSSFYHDSSNSRSSPNEARFQNQEQRVSSYVNELSNGDAIRSRNESMNEHIHFDEEQHQQLTNWAQRANRHRLRPDQLVENNQKDYTTTRRPSLANYNNKYQYQNNSSHRNINYNHFSSSEDDSGEPATPVRLYPKVQQRTNENNRVLLRFSPADHSGWSPPSSIHSTHNPTTTTTQSHPLALATTTEIPPPPPVVYFSPDGDKVWNQQQQQQSYEIPAINEDEREASFYNVVENNEDASVQQQRPEITVLHHHHHRDNQQQSFANNHSLTRFNHQRRPVGSATTSKRFDLGQPTQRAEEAKLEDLELLRARQAQLQRLRRQAMLLQLKRNQQLAMANSRFQNYYRATKPRVSSKQHQHQEYHNHLNSIFEPSPSVSNRRWFLSSLGQKLALPGISSAIASPDYATILSPSLDAHEDPKAHLERYFYGSPAVNNLGGARATNGRIVPLATRMRSPLITTPYKVHYSPMFNDASSAILHPAAIRQPTIPRAPPSSTYRDRYLAQPSYDQASYLEASQPLSTDNLDHFGANNKQQAPPGFIPVVAVTVTKTSPAPTRNTFADEQVDQQHSNPDLDEYIEKKTRHYNQNHNYNQQHQHQHQQREKSRYQMNNANDENNSGQSSSQSSNRQNAPNRHSINVRSPSNRDHQQQQQLTTVKSAVFGYLPSQLQDLPPLSPLAPMSLHREPAPSNEKFYQHPPAVPANLIQDSTLPLALQLQANSIVQNDIAHPFGGPGSAPGVDHQGSLMGEQHLRNQQQIPVGHASSTPYIQYANPLITTPDAGSQAVGGLPFGRGSHQAVGQQLIAIAASELNPFLLAGAGRGPPAFITNPTQWLYPQPNSDPSSDHATSESMQLSSHLSHQNTNNNNRQQHAASSKGKKRSGEFFASAGQLLLSALPLLLAPTLGLMFASIPPLPTVSRHQTLPNFPQQAAGNSLSQALQTSIPGSYLNSLTFSSDQPSANNNNNQHQGQSSGMFTPSPPLYSAPTNPYSSHNYQHAKGAAKPTRMPASVLGNRTSSVAQNFNNRFLNATGFNFDTLMNGTSRPAAIVITTTTTSTPQFHRSVNNNTNSYFNNDNQNQNMPNETITTTRQTIAAVDNLSVLSNQTLVFIPASDPRSPPYNNDSAAQGQDEPMNVGEIISVAAASPTSNYLKPNESKPSLGQGGANQAKPATTINLDGSHQTNLSVQNTSELQPIVDGTEMLLKRNHHYELIPAPPSSHHYLDGADFDTQYASLPTNSKQDLQNQTANDATNKSIPSLISDEPEKQLYPVASWPSLRRKTVSLVTSQGNKTYSDSTEKYREGLAARDFIVASDSFVPTKRPNSRLFRRRRAKREIEANNNNNDQDKQESRPIIMRANNNNESSLIINDEPPSLADLEEARQMRDEMLAHKLHFDRVASTNGQTQVSLTSSNQPRLLDVASEPRQQLATGSRGHIAPIQLPSPMLQGINTKYNNTRSKQHQSSKPDLTFVDMSGRESMSDLVGDLMLKNQNEILAQNALDAEVAEDTNTNDNNNNNDESEMSLNGRQEPGQFDAEIVRSGHVLSSGNSRRLNNDSDQNNLYVSSLSSNLPQISTSDQFPVSNNARRSAEFSRQVKYSNQVGNHNLRATRGRAAMSPALDSSQHNWAQRDTADFIKQSNSSLFGKSSPNNGRDQMKPMLDYERPRRTQSHNMFQQEPENGASTLSSYATNDFRPSLQMGGSTDSDYNYNNYQRPYMQPNYGHNSSMMMSQYGRSQQPSTTSANGYSGRNYYPPHSQNLMINTREPNYMAAPQPPIQGAYPNAYSNNNSYGFNNYANHRIPAGSSQNEDYAPYQQQQMYQQPAGRARYDQNYQQQQQQAYYHNHQPYNNQQPATNHPNDYYRVPQPSMQAQPQLAPHQQPAMGYNGDMSGLPLPPPQMQPPARSIGPYGLMEDQQQQMGHYAAGSMLAHQAGPLASLAANNSNDSGTVNEYLKQVHFSDSDRDKLMASYLTCDGLLNDSDHCLERLSCEFSDPLNIEKANKLDRAVSSILLGHILINTYIPNNFKHRLKAASLFGYKHSGKCSRFVCNKLINKQQQQQQQTQQHHINNNNNQQQTSSATTSSDNTNQSSSID